MKYEAYKFRMLAQAVVTVFVIIAAFSSIGGPKPNVWMTGVSLACMLWLVQCRTTWLPFLGPTVMPVGLLKPHIPHGANMTLNLQAPEDAVRVIFWGSVVKSKDPIRAYGGYSNAGISDVVGGHAVIKLKTPKVYAVNGTLLPRHVHYRWITSTGMLSAVKTAYV